MKTDYKNINGLNFTQAEINANLKNGGLLSIELEFSKRCNLKCKYCYAYAGEKLSNELSLQEIKAVIDQAANLGAKKIVLLGGGEPLMYETIPEIVKYIYEKRLQQTIFTNGILLTKELSALFFKYKVSIVVKKNSNIPFVQDELSGVNGSFEKINTGINRLIETGYPNKDCLLGIQTIICKQNIKEIPELWIWAREQAIIPYFEIITYQGRAIRHPELFVPIEEIKTVFEKLRDIDMERFGNYWDTHPTIAAFSCKRHLYSCLVNSTGNVQPCTGVDLPLGNIRQKSLREILEESTEIKKLRNIRKNIEGNCASCKYADDCYGCRGNAYKTTGNFLASDPSCWFNNEHSVGSYANIINIS